MSFLGTIFNSILGGVSASAKSKADAKAAKEDVEGKGLQDRKTLIMGAQLEDYYRMKVDDEKRKGFQNYNQFNSLQRFAPQYRETAPVPVMPQMPVATK
jgi:hypothetical protein